MLAGVVVIFFFYWRSLQRVIVKDMRHMRKIMLSLDKQGDDEIDTADFCRALNMPMDVWANRLVRMLAGVLRVYFLTHHMYARTRRAP